MSLASRQKQYDRRYRAGFPTWEAFWAWQAQRLALFDAAIRPSLIAANLAIAFFAWEDGYAPSCPSQEELDALWAAEEKTLLRGAA